MNVATKLLLQQMESDIKNLKQCVAELVEAVVRLQGEREDRKLTPSVKRTLSLPENRKANG